jgi:SPP1 family predicted phage head-tail adaptor
MPAAGILNKRVQLTHAPEEPEQNEYGEVTSADEVFATVWASIVPVSARDSEVAKGFAHTVSHKITIRYRDDVDYPCSVVWNSRTFNVNGIVNTNEDDLELVLFATEVA